MKEDCDPQVKFYNVLAAGFGGAILFKEPSPSDPKPNKHQKLVEEKEGLCGFLVPIILTFSAISWNVSPEVS